LAKKVWLGETLENCRKRFWWLGGGGVGVCGGGGWGALGALLVWWLLRALRIAIRARARSSGWAGGMLYGLHCQLLRLPVVVGQVKGLLKL